MEVRVKRQAASYKLREQSLLVYASKAEIYQVELPQLASSV